MPEPIPLLNGLSRGGPQGFIEVCIGDHCVVIQSAPARMPFGDVERAVTIRPSLLMAPDAARRLAEELLRAARISEEPAGVVDIELPAKEQR